MGWDAWGRVVTYTLRRYADLYVFGATLIVLGAVLWRSGARRTRLTIAVVMMFMGVLLVAGMYWHIYEWDKCMETAFFNLMHCF
jgi:hypothetical protein